MGKCDVGNLSDLNSRRGLGGSSRLSKRINEVLILSLEKFGQRFSILKKWPFAIIESKRFEFLYKDQLHIASSHRQKAQDSLFYML